MQRSPIGALALAFGALTTAVGCQGSPDDSDSPAADVAALSTPRVPIADAYVRDGGFGRMSFGSSASLLVKQSTQSYNRWAYLTFDVASLGGAVTEATVRVHGHLLTGITSATARMALFPVEDTSWQEPTLAWSRRPAPGPAPLATATIDNRKTWRTFDVSAYVKEQVAAGKTKVSFVLRNLDQTSAYAQLSSREASENRPELGIVVAAPPAPPAPTPPAPEPAPPVATMPPAPEPAPPVATMPPAPEPTPPVATMPPAPEPTPPVATMPPAPPAPPATTGPSIEGCPMLPADNEWNRKVTNDPVDPLSATYLSFMRPARTLHPDFGSNTTYGIPWVTVSGTQPKVPVTFEYADESDPGPYPIPPDAPVEGGPGATGDRHVLVLDRDNCMLYETFASVFVGPGWKAGSGAIFDLRSNALRPDGFTSADAAGLPILPGLVRRSEIEAGRIDHALRFTMERTQRAYVRPGTHYASDIWNQGYPPLGIRMRLKADFDISGYTGAAKVILTAMKEYGMFLADNGGDWYFSGEQNPGWNDDDLNQLKRVPGSAFEVLRTGEIYR